MNNAKQWWDSLRPGVRAVYLQALWGMEGEPQPLPRKPCDYRNPECTNDGRIIYGRWVCSNHDNQ